MHNLFYKLLNHNGLKIRILQYLFFFSTIYAIFLMPGYILLTSLLTYGFLVTVGGNIGLHRYFGHNSFETSTAIRSILLFFSNYIGVGSIISWVGQHRIHHSYADTDKDIHSPYTNNIIKTIFGLWTVNISKKLIIKESKQKDIVWYHKNYFKFHLFIISFWLILDFSMNTSLFFIMYAIPGFLCLLSGYILAFLTHYHGYQTYKVDDKSTNSWIANILTLGEGWHNNHHKHPHLWDTKVLNHEWDLPAFIIKKIKI